jgi:hypothetical protein
MSTDVKLCDFILVFHKGLMLGIRERAASRQIQHMALVTANGSKPITESIAVVSFYSLLFCFLCSPPVTPLVLAFFSFTAASV